MRKKRLISILLSCCMILTLLPAAVFAEGGSEETPEAALILENNVTNYETVTAAVAAAQEDGNSGCTVKLLKNITLSAPLWANKGTFTLDLAGFCLTGKFGRDRATLRLGKESAADLTVTDSSETGTGCIENTTGLGDSSAVLAGGGKLTVNGGRFRNGLQVDDNAQVRINGGTFVRTRWYNFEWGASAGGFTLKVTDGRQVHDLLREGYELYYDEENRFVNCHSGKQYYENELTLRPHPTHNNKGDGECDCGYVCPHKEFLNGVCTVCKSAAFAKLTDSTGTETKYFATLADAFNAVPDKSDTDTVYTVTVLESRKLSMDWQTIWNKRMTLDLGGQTLSQCWIAIKGETELTVTGNGTMNEYSKIDISGNCALYVKDGTIESVSVASSTQGENGTVYLQGGTIGLSLYKSGDAVLTGGTLTSLIQADFTAMGTAPSVPLSGIIPVGYALEYADGHRGKLPRDTGIKDNDDLRRTTLRVVSCDHSGRDPIENNRCIYCGAENRIYYDLQGGRINDPNPSCCSDSEDITLHAPVRKGYRFVGWSGTGIKDVSPNVTIPKGSTGERHYTAHWEEKSGFTAHFDTDGGTDMKDRTDLKWNDPVLSGVPQPSKKGFVFLGWECNGTIINEKASYAELASDDTVMTVTLTAKWRQTEPPVIQGLTEGAAYCADVKFSVSGEKRIISVKADNAPLTADSDGQYILRKGCGEVTVSAEDEDGKTTTVTVTVYSGHTYGDWMVTREPTTVRAGEKIRTCTVCDYEQTAQISPLEEPKHRCVYDRETIKDDALKTAADCTHDAVYYKSCTCGTISSTATFTATDTKLRHNWKTDWSKDNENHWHECLRCHEQKDKTTHAFGTDNKCTTCDHVKTHIHTQTTYVPARAATCTESGNKAYYICAGCDAWFEDESCTKQINDKLTVLFAPIGHKAAGEWQTSENQHWKTCTCGLVMNRAGHTPGDWIIDKAASEATVGSKHKECTICGCKTASVDIPATGSPTQPTNPTKPADDKNIASSKTGDSSNITLWFALLLISGGAVTGAALYGKKRKNNAE